MLELNSNSIIYQASALTFDPSVIELFVSLYVGGQILILPQIIKLMPNILFDYLIKHKVNMLQVINEFMIE
jgi:acyl-CoA synthetase